MFLNMLNDREQELFIDLAVAIIRADDEVTHTEMVLMRDCLAEMHRSMPDLNRDINIKQILANINAVSSISSKKIIIVELITLANIDDNINEYKEYIIEEVAKALNIADEILNKAYLLYNRYISSARDFMAFIQEDT